MKMCPNHSDISVMAITVHSHVLKRELRHPETHNGTILLQAHHRNKHNHGN